MARKAALACTARVAVQARAVLFASVGASAAVIESKHITFTDKATALNFDFTSAPELSTIKSNSILVEISTNWKFTPGSGQTGSLDLLANLYSPSFASGQNTGVGFATTLDLAGGVQEANSTYQAQSGLNFSNTVISALLGGSGVMPAELVGAGAGFSNLDTFFAAGGKVEGFVTLKTLDPRGPGGGGGGGGGQVPEPTSVLVWGAVALGAMARRKLAAA